MPQRPLAVPATHEELLFLLIALRPGRQLMPQAPQEWVFAGLNLLSLLLANRIAEFHTELELIPDQVLAASSPRTKHCTVHALASVDGVQGLQHYVVVVQTGYSTATPSVSSRVCMLAGSSRVWTAAGVALQLNQQTCLCCRVVIYQFRQPLTP
jgi:hypothetical protein